MTEHEHGIKGDYIVQRLYGFAAEIHAICYSPQCGSEGFILHDALEPINKAIMQRIADMEVMGRGADSERSPGLK